MRYWVAFCCVAMGVGCTPPRPVFEHDEVLGGINQSADLLNHGHRFYSLHCAGCHGARGDGRGEAGTLQIPPPRDLRLGIIKFASVRAGSLPIDGDFARILRGGLQGTGMQPWRFRDVEITALTAYVKTFSPRWRSEGAGTPVVMSPDPWHDSSAATSAGRALFVGAAGCSRCHAAGADMPTPSTPRSPSAFGELVAPDLSRPGRRAGDTPEDLYRVTAAGIGGTEMVSVVDQLSPRQIWALVYYLRSIAPSTS